MWTCNLVLVKYVKIEELWKIDGLCKITHFTMLTCNWVYANDKMMNNDGMS